MNIIIYDFEVFKHDTLLGAIIIEEGKEERTIQTWNLNDIRKFYNTHKEHIWIGWNNNYYDDLILEAIVNGRDPYKKSVDIIERKIRSYPRIKLYSYDLLNSVLTPPSLKLTEGITGKSIDTTDVDFNLQRPLTMEEKLLTEEYNLSDLKMTKYNFGKFYDKFILRIMLINEFNLPFQMSLRATDTMVAGWCLKSKHDPSLKYQAQHPVLYNDLQIKDKEVLDFYISERWKEGETLEKDICGTTVTIASGGMHSKNKKYHCKHGILADITSYYPNIMIQRDLLPRTMNEESRKLFKQMYDEQIRLKKIDPVKRKTYKKIINSVYGAMGNEHTDFYDPWRLGLVCLTGEMYIYDLLEKLEPYGIAFNVNTDGVMIEPFKIEYESKIHDIIKEWSNRIGFPVEIDIIEDYWGRDVNAYIMKQDNQIIFKGEIVKNYDFSDKAYADFAIFNCKEPPIIAQGVVECLLNNIPPEQYVEAHKHNLKLFSYFARKVSFKKLTYKLTNVKDNSEVEYDIQSPSRVFAYNCNKNYGMVYKHKQSKKGIKTSKVASLPDNVFVWNDEVLSEEAYEKIADKINWQYYIDRIYERIGEFL